jgi:hypothetical protein
LSSHHLNNLAVRGNEAFSFRGNHEAAPFTQTLNYSAAHVLFPACKNTRWALAHLFGVSYSGSGLPLAWGYIIPP